MNHEVNQALIELQGGVKVDSAQAKEALFQAMLIIEKIGTPGIEYAWPQADRWLQAYFPSRVFQRFT